jgi:XisI protein
MDKSIKYSQLIQDLLAEYVANPGSSMPSVQTQILTNLQAHHYQLLRIGWHNNRFIHTIMFHFDIIGEKVWIQQNNTDVLIADELMERGVLRSDIVLGFVPENARQHSGFSVA